MNSEEPLPPARTGRIVGLYAPFLQKARSPLSTNRNTGECNEQIVQMRSSQPLFIIMIFPHIISSSLLLMSPDFFVVGSAMMLRADYG